MREPTIPPPIPSDPAIAAAVREFLAAPVIPPPTVTPARAPLEVVCPPGVSETLAIARMVTRGLGHNALLIDNYTTPLSGAMDLTACVTALPRLASAVSFILVRMKALIWLGEYFLPLTSTQASPLSPDTIW